jgi:hypothetical protein
MRRFQLTKLIMPCRAFLLFSHHQHPFFSITFISNINKNFLCSFSLFYCLFLFLFLVVFGDVLCCVKIPQKYRVSFLWERIFFVVFMRKERRRKNKDQRNCVEKRWKKGENILFFMLLLKSWSMLVLLSLWRNESRIET